MERPNPPTAPIPRGEALGPRPAVPTRRSVEWSRPQRAPDEAPRYDARPHEPDERASPAGAERPPHAAPRPIPIPPPRSPAASPSSRRPALGAAALLVLLVLIPVAAVVAWRVAVASPLLGAAAALVGSTVVVSHALALRSAPTALASPDDPARRRWPIDGDRRRPGDDPRPAYAAYLRTAAWHERRRAALRRAGARCQLCNAAGPLEVHHRTYERLGWERPEDLVVLCRGCHALFHGHRTLDRRQRRAA